MKIMRKKVTVTGGMKLIGMKEKKRKSKKKMKWKKKKKSNPVIGIASVASRVKLTGHFVQNAASHIRRPKPVDPQKQGQSQPHPERENLKRGALPLRIQKGQWT